MYVSKRQVRCGVVSPRVVECRGGRGRCVSAIGGGRRLTALLIKYRWWQGRAGVRCARGGGAAARQGRAGAGRGRARARRAGREAGRSFRCAPRTYKHVRPRARAMVARTDESMFGCYGDSYSYRLWSLANVWGACRCEQCAALDSRTCAADVSGGCESPRSPQRRDHRLCAAVSDSVV